MLMVSLDEIKKGDEFRFSKYIQKKTGTAGTLKVSALYTPSEILIQQELLKKGYLVKYLDETNVSLKDVKTGDLVRDIKTGEVWKFPKKVLAVASWIHKDKEIV